MSFSVFLYTFGIIFLAELGDKTQLTALALAARYPWKKVFLGLALAFALLNLAAVFIGKLLFTFVPLFWIKLASGGLFIFFGLAALWAEGDAGPEEGTPARGAGMRGPFLTAFLLILLAELGDKTQLVTASLAARHDAPFAVFSGATLALWSVSLLGMFFGRQLTRLIPPPYIRKGAGWLFLAFGAVILGQAYLGKG